MLKIIFIIVLIILVFFIFLFIFNCITTRSRLLKYFKSSVIVFGSKGSGKDLLFQKVIYLKRKERYFSNIPYGYKYNHVDIKDLSVSPNTYQSFILGEIEKIPRNENMEGADVYISDAGIHLPSTYDSMLSRLYPSFPIYYALSRQLYDQNIHCNTQALSRLWKQLREQADKYIKCIWSIKIFGIFIIKCRFYDKYESAYNNLLPMSLKPFNKYQKAIAEQYRATNGEIVNGFVVFRKKHIKYDTRYFKNILFSCEKKRA